MTLIAMLVMGSVIGDYESDAVSFVMMWSYGKAP
jgi:hypothetical protein